MRQIKIIHKTKMCQTREILNNYLIELSAFDPNIKFDKSGMPIYRWFDCYWEDYGRYPFLFTIDNEVAGLALIRELKDKVYEMAEFYVLPKFRKNNNAMWFATELTNLFDGEFEISTRFTNPRAIRFWSKFVSQYKNNSFVDDDKWRNWKISNKKY